MSFLKKNCFMCLMLFSIISGSITGLFWSNATVLEPLGTVFINLMFCVVVPMVFFSISSAIANMPSIKKVVNILLKTVVVFIVTAVIASFLMFVIVSIFDLVPEGFINIENELESEFVLSDLINGFLTKPDFSELFSCKAILPLIIAAIIFGFSVQLAGENGKQVASFLGSMTEVMMKSVKIISYYAPIGFFGFFANLIATFGPTLIGSYGKALIIYYSMCFVYVFVFSPIYAKFGGGKGAEKVMYRHLFAPAAVSFGTCSSVATIPVNMKACEECGVSKEVSDIVIPLGSTMHMDGSAMGCIIKVAFLFGFFGIPFTPAEAIPAILVSALASVAMSGIPGGGGTGDLVLCSIFFPEEIAIALPISLALANLIDPPATMVNASMDYVATFIVSKYVNGKDWLQEKLKRF